jgi:hypothetical protein
MEKKQVATTFRNKGIEVLTLFIQILSGRWESFNFLFTRKLSKQNCFVLG